jgi:hypothetical protein
MQHTTSRPRRATPGVLLAVLAAGSLLWAGAPAQAAPGSAAVRPPAATRSPGNPADTADAGDRSPGADALAGGLPASVQAAPVRPAEIDGYSVVGGPVTLYNSPGTSPAGEASGEVLDTGEPVYLECFEFGQPQGPYSNPLWYFVTFGGGGGGGWINDHNLNTPGTGANPQPLGSPCEPTVGPGDTSGYWPDPTSQFSTSGSTTFGNYPTTYSTSGTSFGSGERVTLYCAAFGAPTGPYNNTLWYWAYDPTHNIHGWINDHNLNTPGTAANPQVQTTHCLWAFPN